jgi:AcrR family transcriptional regulator
MSVKSIVTVTVRAGSCEILSDTPDSLSALRVAVNDVPRGVGHSGAHTCNTPRIPRDHLDTIGGDGRHARSARSRASIVDAAHLAFVERGYVSTTIEAIATRAGVSAQTVYATFGNKPALLEAVLDSTIVGDHDEVPVLSREWVGELEQIADRRAAAANLGTGVTRVLARTAGIFAVLSRAAGDPALGALLTENRRRRRRDVHALVARLARNGLLRDDLTVRQGADVLFAIASEDVYLLLAQECGWSDVQVAAWITEAIERLIVA